jgi:hypothetical protein
MHQQIAEVTPGKSAPPTFVFHMLGQPAGQIIGNTGL